jgi:protein tyrosine phosphatase
LTETPAIAATIERADAERDRYSDMRCYIHNKVSLPPSADQVPGFYINASFIASPFSQRAYIATQAPLPRTMEDFFRVIHSYGVKGILCLAGESECFAGKCHSYWPTQPGQILVFGRARVKLLSVDENDVFIRRKVVLNFDSYDEFEIQLVQFLAWPDHGVPDIFHAEGLVSELDKLRALAPNSPVAVHCSAGVGRTGCLIGIANTLEAARATGKVSVLDTVLELRRQRPFMVQTTGQYEMVYKAAAKLLLSP